MPIKLIWIRLPTACLNIFALISDRGWLSCWPVAAGLNRRLSPCAPPRELFGMHSQIWYSSLLDSLICLLIIATLHSAQLLHIGIRISFMNYFLIWDFAFTQARDQTYQKRWAILLHPSLAAMDLQPGEPDSWSSETTSSYLYMGVGIILRR